MQRTYYCFAAAFVRPKPKTGAEIEPTNAKSTKKMEKSLRLCVLGYPQAFRGYSNFNCE
jgi:hypothetical protein